MWVRSKRRFCWTSSPTFVVLVPEDMGKRVLLVAAIANLRFSRIRRCVRDGKLDQISLVLLR